MPPQKRVAFVSQTWGAYAFRLMLGSLAYAEANSNLLIRDFRLSRDFQNDDSPDTALNHLRKWNPDGLLCFLEAEPLERMAQSLLQSRPVVNMCHAQIGPGVAVVTGGMAAWLEMGIRHLREQGLRSFAYLNLESLPKQKKFDDFFYQITRPANPTTTCFVEVVKPTILEDPHASVSPVPARLAAWLRQLPKPVGVVCPTTGGGGYLIRVCHKLGLRVPEDVAVVGVDDADLAIASKPALTTVLLAAHQIGREAMQLLDQMMNGKPAPPEVVLLNAMDLHVRESTGLKRAEICDIAAALEYINRHACHGLSVEQLMKETQRVCKGTFHKHFLTSTGQTPGDAIQQRQIEEAQRLLANTELSITTIAENSGFCNSSNFARTFRDCQGMSPRDYRNRAKAKKPRVK